MVKARVALTAVVLVAGCSASPQRPVGAHRSPPDGKHARAERLALRDAETPAIRIHGSRERSLEPPSVAQTQVVPPAIVEDGHAHSLVAGFTARGYYDLGRALELEGDTEGARVAYLGCLAAQQVPAPSIDSSIAFLRTFARECNSHPALAKIAWRETRTEHFFIFREAGSTDDEPSKDFDGARDAALVRLGFSEDSVPRSRRVAVFVIEGSTAFHDMEISPVPWADGCASFCSAWDDRERTIYVTHRKGQLVSLVRHEIAHVLAGEAFTDTLPIWAVEGVACYAQDDDDHTPLWFAAGCAPGARPFDLDVLNRTGYLDLSGPDVYTFYARSHAVFDVLVQKTGGVSSALRVSSVIGRSGAEAGLSQVPIDVGSFELAVAEKVRTECAARYQRQAAVLASRRPHGVAASGPSDDEAWTIVVVVCASPIVLIVLLLGGLAIGALRSSRHLLDGVPVVMTRRELPRSTVSG